MSDKSRDMSALRRTFFLIRIASLSGKPGGSLAVPCTQEAGAPANLCKPAGAGYCSCLTYCVGVMPVTLRNARMKLE